MKIHELVVEMKMLERRLTLYEEKYGILSENFYQALQTPLILRWLLWCFVMWKIWPACCLKCIVSCAPVVISS